MAKAAKAEKKKYRSTAVTEGLGDQLQVAWILVFLGRLPQKVLLLWIIVTPTTQAITKLVASVPPGCVYNNSSRSISETDRQTDIHIVGQH